VVAVATSLNLPSSEMSRQKFVRVSFNIFSTLPFCFCKVLYDKTTEIIAPSPIQKKKAIVKQLLSDILKICSI